MSSQGTPPGGLSLPSATLSQASPPPAPSLSLHLSASEEQPTQAQAQASQAQPLLPSSFPEPSAPPAEAFVSLWPASQGEAALEQAQLLKEEEERAAEEGHDDEGTEAAAAAAAAADRGAHLQHFEQGSFQAAQVPPDELMSFEEEAEAEEERKEFDRFAPSRSPERPSSPLHASVSALRAVLGASPAPPSPAAYAICLRTLVHAVGNVLENPRVEKFRLLPLGNAKFQAKVGGGDARMFERASLLLQRLGWTLVEAGGDASFLLLTDEFRDEATLRHGKSLLEHELASAQELVGGAAVHAPSAAAAATPSFVPAAPVPAATAAAASHPLAAPVAHPVAAPVSSNNLSSLDSLLYQPLSSLKKAYKRKDAGPARPAPTPKLSREQMAARVAERLQGGGHNAASDSAAAPGVRAGRIMNLENQAALRAQISDTRRAAHNKWVRGAQSRKRVYTVADLAAMEEADIKARAALGGGGSSGGGGGGGGAAAAGGKFRTLADFGTGSPQDCLIMGQEMLRLSNEFRAREGKRPLQWHAKLHEIALVHSKRMALKQVAFGHDGAKARFAAYPFPARSAAENVAWSQGVPDVAKCHVDGWIQSPGHRKNLLAHHNWCAIAVFRNNDGAYYSTQLFGLG